jgi:hypothetical protein
MKCCSFISKILSWLDVNYLKKSLFIKVLKFSNFQLSVMFINFTEVQLSFFKARIRFLFYVQMNCASNTTRKLHVYKCFITRLKTQPKQFQNVTKRDEAEDNITHKRNEDYAS